MQRKRDLFNAVILIYAYRDLLPAECRLETRAPWGGAAGDNLVPVPPAGTVNKTRRIAPETMDALLAWSLRMLEDIGPDIIAARQAWQQLRQCAHPSQEGFAGLSQRQRLAVLLSGTAKSGGALPGKHDAEGQLVLDEHHLCRLLGVQPSLRMLRSGLQRRMIAESGLPLTEGCPVGAPVSCGRVPVRGLPGWIGRAPCRAWAGAGRRARPASRRCWAAWTGAILRHLCAAVRRPAASRAAAAAAPGSAIHPGLDP